LIYKHADFVYVISADVFINVHKNVYKVALVIYIAEILYTKLYAY